MSPWLMIELNLFYQYWNAVALIATPWHMVSIGLVPVVTPAICGPT